MKYNLIIVLIILGFILINQLNKKSLKNKYNKVTKTGTVNQDSYQRYAKFYETVVPQDQHFNDKMNKIYEQIEINKKKDIKKIAASAGCTYEECILKIRYLKNKRQINEVDKELVYYTIEKRKKEKDYISISCDNCGALNDVNRGSKVRCAYCTPL